MENRQIGGWLGILGNTAVFANGFLAWKFGDTPQRRAAGVNRMVSGGLWNVPSVVLTRYGASPVDAQFERLQHKLAEHLKQESVPLHAHTLKLADEEERQAWFGKAENFLYNHPMECNFAFFAAASAGMMASGLIRRKSGEKESGVGNIIVSSFSIAAALAAILIPERTDEQIEQDGHKGTIIGALQKRPMSCANIMILAGDLTEGVNAHGEFKTARSLPNGNSFKPYGYAMSGLSALTMGSFLTGDALAGFGSKKVNGAPEEHKAAQEALVREAARILASQPQEARESIVEDAARYMTHQQELRMVDLDPMKLKKDYWRRLMRRH